MGVTMSNAYHGASTLSLESMMSYSSGQGNHQIVTYSYWTTVQASGKDI